MVERTNDLIFISYDRDAEHKNIAALLVGRKKVKNGGRGLTATEIINEFFNEEAIELYKKLVGEKGENA